MALPAGTLIATCTPPAQPAEGDGQQVQGQVCPQGYTLAYVNSVPVGPGDLNVANVSLMFGVAAVFYAMGISLGVIRRGA